MKLVTYLANSDEATAHELMLFHAIQPFEEKRKRRYLWLYVLMIATLPLLTLLYLLGYIGVPNMSAEQITNIFYMLFPMTHKSDKTPPSAADTGDL